MSVQKQYSKSAYAAFSPTAPLVVAGTANWNNDGVQPSLEILSLDMLKSGLELPRVGQTVPLASPVTCIAWGTMGIASGKSKYGLLAGALSTGEIGFWDPTAMISKPNPVPIIHSWKPSAAGKVTDIAFNPYSPNIIAVTTSAGELMLYDIGAPRAPKCALGEDPPFRFSPPGGAGSARGAPEALTVRFNNLSERIVAIGYANGRVAVYDTRNRRQAFEWVDDNAPRRTSAVSWSPTEQTQLVFASEDDRSPTLMLWDLRRHTAPALEFAGHSRGVTSAEWCPHDGSLLLSAGKDQQTLVWDTRSGDRLGGLDAYEQTAIIQVAWSPSTPGLFLSCQAGAAVRFGTHTGCACAVEHVSDAGTGAVTPYRVSRPLPRAPAWLRRRCSARFGWGGRLATARPPGRGDTSPVVSVAVLDSEPALREHSAAFEEAIVGDLRRFCAQKVDEERGAANEAEAEYWSFIEVLLEGDNCREAMLSKLGFASELAATTPDGGAVGASAQVEAASAALQAAALNANGDGAESPTGGEGEGGDFFDNVGAAAAAASPKPPFGAGASSARDFFEEAALSATPRGGGASHRAGLSAATSLDGGGALVATGHSGEVDGHGEGEKEIERALFVGNHAAAIATALAHDRLADAFVIAHVANDAALWHRTLAAYVATHPRPYLTVVEAQLAEDWDSLIKQRPVGRWADTLAILLTYAPPDDFARLAGVLARRLGTTGMAHAATLCHICALDVDAAIKLWLDAARRGGKAAGGAAVPTERLQSVLEKSIALGLATQHAGAAASLADLLANYALQLAAQGCLRSAITYLNMLPSAGAAGGDGAALAILRDRVFRAAEGELSSVAEPPAFPFDATDVPPSAAGYEAQQAAYATAYAAAQQQAQAQAQQQAQLHAMASSQPSAGGYGGGGPGYGYAPAPPAISPAASSASNAYDRFRYDPAGNHGGGGGGGAGGGHLRGYPPAEPTPPQLTPAAPRYDAPSTGPAYGGPVAPAAPAKAYAAPPVAPVAPAAPYSAPAPQRAGPDVYGPPPPAAPTSYQPAAPRAASGPPSARFQPQHVAAPHVPAPITGAGPPRGGPPQQAPPPPPPPPPPVPQPPEDCSIYTIDTSHFTGANAVIAQQLTALYVAAEPLAQQSTQKRREVEDAARRLGLLFWNLASGGLSDQALGLLEALATAIGHGDWAAALQQHARLTASHWDECSQWLQTIRRLIKARQQMG